VLWIHLVCKSQALAAVELQWAYSLANCSNHAGSFAITDILDLIWPNRLETFYLIIRFRCFCMEMFDCRCARSKLAPFWTYAVSSSVQLESTPSDGTSSICLIFRGRNIRCRWRRWQQQQLWPWPTHRSLVALQEFWPYSAGVLRILTSRKSTSGSGGGNLGSWVECPSRCHIHCQWCGKRACR